MVIANLVIAQFYVMTQGGDMLSFMQLVKVIGLIILSIMTFSSFFFFIAIYMKTRNAFGTLSTLVGTFIGFLGGIYIPIGVLSKSVQNVVNLIPTAHAVTLMRRVFMQGAIDQVFDGAPEEAYQSYADIYGLNVNIFGYTMTNWQMVLSMVIFMTIFYLLSVIKLSHSKL
ncbi:MAG: ABC transporter permease [Candidatus Izemoplasma sp.]|nr:ABC transporter permease [Candidatus Izemoplasma sp.]